MVKKSEVKVKVAQLYPSLCDPMDYTVHGILQARILELVAFSLLQGIIPTWGSNPGFLHCKCVLYQLSHKGSPRILEWVAYLFSTGSSWPRNRTRVSCIAGKFFTNWAIKEAPDEFFCNVGDLGSISELGRFPDGLHYSPLQYPCLENPHGQQCLVGYSPWSQRVRHDWVAKHSIQWFLQLNSEMRLMAH